MRLEFGPYIKSLGPATATVDINVVELAEDERFDQETMERVTMWIVEQHKEFYAIMEFDDHQTFWGVYNFHYQGETITTRAFPLYTQNFRSFG